MKKSIQVLVPVILTLLLLGSGNAMAKRLGGGKSIGRQSSSVSQSQSTSPSHATESAGDTAARPGQRSNQGQDGVSANVPAAAPAVAGPARRPWGGALLGGLAAGLGLAWLASSMGFSDGFGSVVLMALLLGGFLWLWFRALRLRRGVPMAMSGGQTPFAFQGVTQRAAAPRAPYRPENVGNDASARPFERSHLGELSATPEALPTPATAAPANWSVPEGFDTAGFLAAAQANFVALQAAWDRADIPTLRAMMTDGMLDEIRVQLAERESQGGAQPNSTDVVMIDARLLGIETFPTEYVASVEFSGMIREEPSAGPSPFREVWNMSKPRNGQTGWLVAGVQALQ